MSNNCEISIEIINDEYKDELIVALVNQGYEVYYNADSNCVCFIAPREDINMPPVAVDNKSI